MKMKNSPNKIDRLRSTTVVLIRFWTTIWPAVCDCCEFCALCDGVIVARFDCVLCYSSVCVANRWKMVDMFDDQMIVVYFSRCVSGLLQIIQSRNYVGLGTLKIFDVDQLLGDGNHTWLQANQWIRLLILRPLYTVHRIGSAVCRRISINIRKIEWFIAAALALSDTVAKTLQPNN